MNRKNVSERFDYARRLKDYHSACVKPVVYDHVEVEKKTSDTLLSVVYAPDSRSGLPTGDLQYFVSDKASADVKQFILDNLMMDTSPAKSVANPSGLSDDALLELSRGNGETVEAYANRLKKNVDDFKFLKEELGRQSKVKSLESEK